jgi:hypothetical protein
LSRIWNALFSRPCTSRIIKPIGIFAFSAPEKTFQRIWPLLVTVEIAPSFERLAWATATGAFPFGAEQRTRAWSESSPVSSPHCISVPSSLAWAAIFGCSSPTHFAIAADAGRSRQDGRRISP